VVISTCCCLSAAAWPSTSMPHAATSSMQELPPPPQHQQQHQQRAELEELPETQGRAVVLLKAGDAVTIAGLSSDTGRPFNGHRATVLSVPTDDSERYVVQLRLLAGAGGGRRLKQPPKGTLACAKLKTLRCKRIHLQPALLPQSDCTHPAASSLSSTRAGGVSKRSG
jgi:hypothetical protein